MKNTLNISKILTPINNQGVRIDGKALRNYYSKTKDHAVFSAYIYSRVYPQYMCKENTGRIYTRNPNIQALPKTEARKIIVPNTSEDFLFYVDYKMAEFSIFVDHVIQNDYLRENINDGVDLFYKTAKFLELPRVFIKKYIYAFQYGAGKRCLDRIIKCKTKQNHISNYFQLSKNYWFEIDDMGFMKTAVGNHIKAPKLTYMQLNYYLQGSVAALMTEVLKKLFYHNITPYIMIHDAFIFSLNAKQLKEQASIIEGIAKKCLQPILKRA